MTKYLLALYTALLLTIAPAMAQSYELYFDGVDDSADTGTNLSIDAESTGAFQCEMKLDTGWSGDQGVYWMRKGATNRHIQIESSNSKFQFKWGGSTTDADQNSPQSPTDEQWHTVRLEFDYGAGTYKGFVDGTQVLSTQSATDSGTFNRIGIGERQGNYFKGWIRNVVIEQPISTVVHSWALDDNSSTLVDSVGSVNMTLTGGTWQEISNPSSPPKIQSKPVRPGVTR